MGYKPRAELTEQQRKLIDGFYDSVMAMRNKKKKPLKPQKKRTVPPKPKEDHTKAVKAFEPTLRAWKQEHPMRLSKDGTASIFFKD